MRSSTVRKIEYTEHTQVRAEIINLADARDVAQIAEAACQLVGNAEACDFEEFMNKYDMKLSGDFE